MSNEKSTDLMTRREFTLETAMALLAGVTITVSGCGGSDRPSMPASPSPTPAAGATGSVSANHGHVATISSMELTAGGALMLNIRGNATHPHTVSLSADEVRAIGARTQVTKTSSFDDGHTHTVTFN